MAVAVANYQAYRQSPEAWMLGRFVVPVSRLDEFEECFPSNAPAPQVSALAGGDLEADLARIARARFSIDTIEIKTLNIESATARIPAHITPYFEVTDLSRIPAIRDAGGRAKIRTGGVTPEAFPSAGFIAEFLAACAKTATPFKATAGLHHPLRCFRPLTYSADGPSGWMFGFLNVFLAAAFARQGLAPDELGALLQQDSMGEITISDDCVAWNHHDLPVAAIASARRDFAISFGSCSFEEPISDLKHHNLL